MHINTRKCALEIEPSLVAILSRHLSLHQIEFDSETASISLNFRDQAYSAKHGGYHPVEIGFNNDCSISYITEFSYVGTGACTELAKALDFEFSLGIFQQFDRVYPIETAVEVFQLWQQNFCHYYNNGIYDVTVNGGQGGRNA